MHLAARHQIRARRNGVDAGAIRRQQQQKVFQGHLELDTSKALVMETAEGNRKRAWLAKLLFFQSLLLVCGVFSAWKKTATGDPGQSSVEGGVQFRLKAGSCSVHILGNPVTPFPKGAISWVPKKMEERTAEDRSSRPKT